ncbi:MAG: diguanylate cyclase, partial [Atopobiaceae bacterium]|nr:diguanylate cyclase [Atopobiaceae bacterium]
TAEQVEALREIGCDMAQGYYFSPPVPPEEFEPFLIEARENLATREVAQAEDKRAVSASTSQKRPSLLKRLSERLNIPLKQANVVFVCVAVVVAAALYAADTLVTQRYVLMGQAGERYMRAQESATDLETGSDVLTSAVRSFVVTGDFKYLQAYFTEANVTRRRDNAVDSLESMMSKDSAAYQNLATALELSNELMVDEYQAMNLILSTGEYDEALVPDELKERPLTVEDAEKSSEEKQSLALELVYGERYEDYKTRIRRNAELCTENLIHVSNQERLRQNKLMDMLLSIQTALTILLLAVVLVIALFISVWIRMPLTRMVEHMRAKETVPTTGAAELRFVSQTYNAIFDENRRTQERLTYGNMHDALTALYNRSAYDFMRHDLDMSKNALLLADVDKFKSINDTYGHDVGDLVLKRVAEVLKYSFRATDLVFRLGGDEFVVIMSNADSSMRDLVRRKIEQANVMLQKPTDDLPPTSLSVGVAFADRENPEGDIFKDADTALYRMKEAGRCGCYIY